MYTIIRVENGLTTKINSWQNVRNAQVALKFYKKYMGGSKTCQYSIVKEKDEATH